MSVTDGDTLRVRIGGRSERVPLLGIDTPETRRPGVAVECGGQQATGYMKRLARAGARVRVQADPPRTATIATTGCWPTWPPGRAIWAPRWSGWLGRAVRVRR